MTRIEVLFINSVLFLDLKKAFDTVDPNILIDKIEANGVQGYALRWFTSYLSGRKKVCRIDNKMSDTANITSGVRKGQILGCYSS